jgi:hypothetical protein
MVCFVFSLKAQNQKSPVGRGFFGALALLAKHGKAPLWFAIKKVKAVCLVLVKAHR